VSKVWALFELGSFKISAEHARRKLVRDLVIPFGIFEVRIFLHLCPEVLELLVRDDETNSDEASGYCCGHGTSEIRN